jgi:hypothetical protein
LASSAATIVADDSAGWAWSAPPSGAHDSADNPDGDIAANIAAFTAQFADRHSTR